MLGLVLETALDAVVVMDALGTITDWNALAQATFGWTRGEAIGQQLAGLLIPQPFREAHRDGLARYLATGDGPVLRQRIEVSALHKTGVEFPVELSIVPVGLLSAPVFLGFIRDISERKRGEALLRRHAREAELLNEVTRLAAETGSLEEVLPVCLAAICELTEWPLGHAFLPTATNPPQLVSSMIWQGDLVAFSALKSITGATAFGLGEGMPGRIWRNRKPYWLARIGDGGDISEYPRLNTIVELGLQAAFGFPIVVAGEVVAVVEFFSRVPARPDERLLLTVRTIGEQIGRVLERRRVQDHQALLLAELDHRAMNMLAVVMGLADQTGRRAESLAGFRSTFSARLMSLSRAYSLMTSKGWRAAELEDVVRQIVRPYLAGDGEQLEMEGPPLPLPPKAGLALGMILHELAANATKYGALSVPQGCVAISWALQPASQGRQVELIWHETGLTGLETPVRSGFGAKLIEASTRRELGGEVEVDYMPQGVRYRFEFPEPRQ
jgi:PAS domain S-box-containing protein